MKRRSMYKISYRIISVIIFAAVAIIAGAVTKHAEKKITIERPDMEQIKKEVNDPTSKYYYPKLMKMYEQNETIMNLDQYRHLYLGTIFQEDYNPYRHNHRSESVRNLYYKENHTRAELDSIINYAEEALSDDPFDLTQMNFLIFALQGRGKKNRAAIWQYRLNHLLEAIISTGTGTDTDNAWFVINPRHEYNIINFQNTIAEKQEFVEPYFDYIRIKKTGDKQPDGYFFNIKNILEEYNRKFPE